MIKPILKISLFTLFLMNITSAEELQDVKFYSLEKEYRKTITWVYKVKNAKALELKQIVRDMLSIYGSLYVNEKTNELYITDVEEKVENLKEALSKLDVTDLKAGNNLVSKVIYLKHVNSWDLRDIIRHKLSPEGQLYEVPYLNAITITDIPSKIIEVVELIDKLDIPAKHISIEITIVEFNNEHFAKLGVNVFNWIQGLNIGAEFHGEDVADLTSGGSVILRSQNKPVISDENARSEEIIRRSEDVEKPLHVRADLSVSDIVNFICEHGDGAVLANTRIVTRNNKYAEFKSGETIPYRHFDHDRLDWDGRESTRYAGITLKVTPNVQEDSLINLNLSPSISDLTGWSPKGMPIIFDRSLKTEVKVKDNALFALGGLKKREAVEIRRGIPGLKDIPVIQYLFSVKQTSIMEREVLIFIRPSTNVSPEIDTKEMNKLMERYHNAQPKKRSRKKR